jgi:hypothetical protein
VKAAWLKLLGFLFGAPEEINGAGRCPTYLWRWHLGSAFGCRVYLHRFTGDDWSQDFHDHPKRFISIGLWGRYLELTPTGEAWPSGKPKSRYCWWSAPWARSFPATHQHRILARWGECWTLVIVLKTVREWGFWHEGRFIPWAEYVRGSSADIADRQRSCQ